jgi:hypothetical protein
VIGEFLMKALFYKSLLATTCLLVSMPAFATPVTILLNTDALGLGATDINYAGNNSPVEADRAGKLVTSTTANVGSVLYVQDNNLAGLGTVANPLLATITTRSHLSVQNNLPAGYDLHAGVITLTNDADAIDKTGLGVRAFAIDTAGTPGSNPNFGKRYVNQTFLNDGDNETGFQMEGSKEISGGDGLDDFFDFVGDNGVPPTNNPPHVDEDVTFDINDGAVMVEVGSIDVLLTKVKAGSGPLDLALNLSLTVVGDANVYSTTFAALSSYPSVFQILDAMDSDKDEAVVMDFNGLDFAGLWGLASTDKVDSFTIGAREDPADGLRETDEHFLISAFSVETMTGPGPNPIPEPSAAVLFCVGALLVGKSVRRQPRV